MIPVLVGDLSGELEALSLRDIGDRGSADVLLQ